MQGVLLANGYALASLPEEADVILVNTCAIREHAEQRVIGRVGELNRIKRDRPELVIGVTGCMAQRIGETILGRASHVDLVMGPDGYRSLPEVLARLRPGRLPSPRTVPAPSGDAANTTPSGLTAATRRALPVLGTPTPSGLPAGAESGPAEGQERIASLELTPDENYEGLEVRRASKVTAWVPIQRGCNYRCTYCIVPYVRGSGEEPGTRRASSTRSAQLAASGITESHAAGPDGQFLALRRLELRSIAASGRTGGRHRASPLHIAAPERPDAMMLIEVMATEPADLPTAAFARAIRTQPDAEGGCFAATRSTGYLEKVSAVRSAVAGPSRCRRM